MDQGTGPRGVVLYVGPEDTDREEFCGVLEESGLSVRETSDWTLESVDERVACVVLDHSPGHDTVETIASARDRWPDLPIVLLGPDDARLAGDAVAAGVSEFVPRTLSDATSVLRERVLSALEATAANDAATEAAPSSDRSSAQPLDRVTPQGGEPVSMLAADEERRLKERAMDEAPVGITIADAERPDVPLIYANAAFERVTGYPPEETLDRNCRFLQGAATDPEPVEALREAIEDEHAETVELQNYRKDGEPFWNEVTIAPVRNADGHVTHFVGFQNDVTDRKEAEQALERERQNLDYLLDRINGLLGSVHADLVEATNRDAVESAVTERIADEAIYSWTWIVRPDPARNRLEVSARAGAAQSTADAIDIPLTGDGTDDRTPLSSLLTTAFETERVEVLEDPEAPEAIDASDSGWLDDVAGIAAIPLVYRETCYGVLTVATTEPDALDDRELVVLEAIARATATAINAIERGRLLSTDAVTEIEFELRDGDLFIVDLSTHLEAAVTYEGAVFDDDGSGQLFCTVAADPDAVGSALESLDVDGRVVTAFDDSALVAVAVGADSIVGRLAERGGTIRSMSAEDGVCTLTVEIPASADARAVVSALEDRHPTIELRSFKELDRPPATRQAFVEELRAELTDRQHTALTVAYVSGFYEWNRSVSGEELAESMDITRSTFHQHRRAAERKLIAAVVDG